MRPSPKALALGSLLLLVAGISVGLRWLHSYYRIETVARIGQPLPPLTLIDIEGRRADFDRYLGRRLLAVFVDLKCGFCQKQLQELGKWSEETDSDGVTLVAVIKHASLLPVDFSQKPAYPFPVWIDAHRQLRKRLGTTTLPALFLLDEQGILRQKKTGYQPLKAVERLIDGTDGI